MLRFAHFACLILATALSGFPMSGLQAADLRIAISALDGKYNGTARKMKSDLRLSEAECKADVAAACQYAVNADLAVVAIGEKPDGPTLQVIAIYASRDDSNAVNAVVMYQTLVRVFSPHLGAAESEALVGSLIDQVSESNAPTQNVRGVRYTMEAPPQKGLWLRITPAA